MSEDIKWSKRSRGGTIIVRPFQRMLPRWRYRMGRMTQMQLAEEMGVTQGIISAWETGRVRASAINEGMAFEWAVERGLVNKRDVERGRYDG